MKKQLAFSLSTFYATKKEKSRKNFQTFSKNFFKRKREEKEKKSTCEKQLAKLPYTIYVLGLKKGRKNIEKFYRFFDIRKSPKNRAFCVMWL